MTPRQSATVLVLLAALYCASLVLLAPQLELLSSRLDTVEGPAVIGWLLAGIMVGVAAASPPFLAIWAVHGRERSSVRLPLTAWLLGLFCLALLYGEVRYYGRGAAQIVVLVGAAWITTFAALLLPLRLLRAVRGWRLQREEPGREAASPGQTRQFTLRTLLVWTSAAAVLFAAIHWVAPYGAFDPEGLPAQAIPAALVESVVLGLIFALTGLPVVSAAWIVLADGRRTVLRCVLVVITAAGIAGGIAAFRLWWDDSDSDFVSVALAIEAGVLIAGLSAASVVRACGYRLVRQPKGVSSPAVPSRVCSSPRNRFALTLAPLAVASILVACYAPARSELWRQADEKQHWESLGWSVDFDDEGHVTSVRAHSDRDLDGAERFIVQWPHLTSLKLSDSWANDDFLDKLPPLPNLQRLELDGSDITDSGLSRLDRFPNLRFLELNRTKVTDAGLSHLSALSKLTYLELNETSVVLEDVQLLKKLESLKLEGTAVGDAGLVHLDRFPNLKTLNLSRTNVSDAGLHSLRALKSLNSLDLRLTEVTDAAVAVLAQFPELHVIELELTAVSEAGCVELNKALPQASVSVGASDAMLDRALVAHVRRVGAGGGMVVVRVPRTLKRLHARGSYLTRDQHGDELQTVTDTGLASLSGQTAMEELDLRESAVTDAGLASLTGLASLKRLDLRGTQVTDAGCTKLTKALPKCEIVR